MQTDTGIETPLKEAVQLSAAVWAVLAERVGGAWLLRAVYHLNKSAQNELMSLMARPSIDAWLCGALSGGHSRSSAIPEGHNLVVERFLPFPSRDRHRLFWSVLMNKLLTLNAFGN
ncbi:MAG: hypothetical protein IPL71_13530 [Anaerolineales bacterium]|uniref:hypothetical protein n=1 Tax=Candidatus Villigracilis proximus TaxID=3140683 RepID=UPI0031356E0C|nr:hypothetical protein [Anaerolineales bacterium]